MKELLLKRSEICAQRAIRHYLSEEYDQFLIQAATSFEQLGKARLAAINVCLIIDRDFDSFLHVCAASKHAKRPPWNIKTITATETLKRCSQVQPALGEFAVRLNLLAEFRNSAIHFGEIVEDERKEIWHAFLASSSLIVGEVGVSLESFFGEFAELVKTHLDKSIEEIKVVVAEKVARANITYKAKYGTLEANYLSSIVKTVEGSYSPKKYEQVLGVCPACGHLGLIDGSFDVEWEQDYDDDGSMSGGYPVVTLTPFTFACRLCGLSLDDATELKAVGLPSLIEIEDVDASDFYDGPDYDERY